MKKIKKFRIKPRPSYVLRGVRSLLGNAPVTPELEKQVDAEVNQAQAYLSTAALYETLDRQNSPETMVPFWQKNEELGSDPVALTCYAATIGPGMEKEIGERLQRGESLKSQLLTALGDEAAEQAAQFVYRLIAEEAKNEGCELSSRAPAVPPDHVRAVLSVLQADKIQIHMDPVGHLSPRFTRVGTILWWPPVKRRKTSEKK